MTMESEDLTLRRKSSKTKAREATMRKAIVFLGMMSVAVTAAAQTGGEQKIQLPLGSFEELKGQQVVKEGDTIWINYTPERQADYLEAKTKVVQLMDSASIVRFGGTHVKIRERRVRQLESWNPAASSSATSGPKSSWDSPWAGVLIGAGVGAGIGIGVASAYCENEAGRNCNSGLVHAQFAGLFGAIAAGIGGIIDASFSLSPILSKEHKGVRLSVTW